MRSKKGFSGSLIISLFLLIFITSSLYGNFRYEYNSDAKDRACQIKGFDSWIVIEDQDRCFKEDKIIKVEFKCMKYEFFHSWCKRYKLYYVVDGGKGE